MNEKDLNIGPSNLTFFDTLRELQSGNRNVTVDPAFIEALKGMGMLNREITSEEYVEKLFAERKEKAIQADRLLGDVPDIPDFPQAALANEMRDCLVLGQNGAGITLGALLIEATLKAAIARKLGDITEPFQKHHDGRYNTEMARLEGVGFRRAIEEAFEIGLIDEEMRKRLDAFRTSIRNPYLHYNLGKITVAGNIQFKNMLIFDAKTGEKKYIDLDLKDQPGLWQMGKKYVDEELAFSVFNFAFEIVMMFFGPKPTGTSAATNEDKTKNRGLDAPRQAFAVN